MTAYETINASLIDIKNRMASTNDPVEIEMLGAMMTDKIAELKAERSKA
jgi:hypothetical protein